MEKPDNLTVEVTIPGPPDGVTTLSALGRWMAGGTVHVSGSKSYKLPPRFLASIIGPGLRIGLEVAVTDRPRVTRLTLDADEALTAAQVRQLPWHRFVDMACVEAGGVVVEREEGQEGPQWLIQPMTEDETRSALAKRRRPVDDSLLARVAEHYRDAIKGREPTGNYVHEALKAEGDVYSKKYVRELIQKARQRGHLGKTTPRRAGERGA
ncbi:MAG: hypothetical protein ACR2GF_02740 [Acidimicrobiales bacterium]